MEGSRDLHPAVLIDQPLLVAVLQSRTDDLPGHLEPFVQNHFEVVQGEVLEGFVPKQPLQIQHLKKHEFRIAVVPPEKVHTHDRLLFVQGLC